MVMTAADELEKWPKGLNFIVGDFSADAADLPVVRAFQNKGPIGLQSEANEPSSQAGNSSISSGRDYILLNHVAAGMVTKFLAAQESAIPVENLLVVAFCTASNTTYQYWKRPSDLAPVMQAVATAIAHSVCQEPKPQRHGDDPHDDGSDRGLLGQ